MLLESDKAKKATLAAAVKACAGDSRLAESISPAWRRVAIDADLPLTCQKFPDALRHGHVQALSEGQPECRKSGGFSLLIATFERSPRSCVVGKAPDQDDAKT